MRNGDFHPSRLDAQKDAVTLIFNAKTQANRESSVALVSMAGKTPEVMTTLTSDLGKILSALHRLKIENVAKLSTGIQISQLVLKHRSNKNQKQRIIVLVGSPISEDESALQKLGKKLKKNNVAVDVINFGQGENVGKLQAFISAVNSNDNSRFLNVEAGEKVLSDVILSSDVLMGEDGVVPGGAGFEFGVDPNMDPELALALRLSLEEEQARQAGASGSSPEKKEEEAPQKAPEDMDEDEMLQQALLMSMMETDQKDEKK